MFEVLLGSDSGKHEDLWGLNRTGGNNDLAVGVRNLLHAVPLVFDAVGLVRWSAE
jgi:hypothetical protein